MAELSVGRPVNSCDSLIPYHSGIETIDDLGVEAVVGYLSSIGVTEFHCSDYQGKDIPPDNHRNTIYTKHSMTGLAAETS